MARTGKPSLSRDPADWAREWGWVSRRRALNLAGKIEAIAAALDGTVQADELRSIAKALAPVAIPAEKARDRSAR